MDVSIPNIDKIAEAAAKAAITDHLTKTGVIQKEVAAALSKVTAEITPVLVESCKEAVQRICRDPKFIEDLLRETILKDRGKLEGAFTGALSKVGRELALDRNTLERLVSKVKEEIAERHEILGMGQFA